MDHVELFWNSSSSWTLPVFRQNVMAHRDAAILKSLDSSARRRVNKHAVEKVITLESEQLDKSFVSFFLGWRIPSLITGLHGWWTSNYARNSQKTVPGSRKIPSKWPWGKSKRRPKISFVGSSIGWQKVGPNLIITIEKYTNCTHFKKFCNGIGVARIHTKATQSQN